MPLSRVTRTAVRVPLTDYILFSSQLPPPLPPPLVVLSSLRASQPKRECSISTILSISFECATVDLLRRWRELQFNGGIWRTPPNEALYEHSETLCLMAPIGALSLKLRLMEGHQPALQVACEVDSVNSPDNQIFAPSLAVSAIVLNLRSRQLVASLSIVGLCIL